MTSILDVPECKDNEKAFLLLFDKFLKMDFKKSKFHL